MKKLSTGDDSTLGNYILLASSVWGKDSPQVSFLNKKVEESPNRENEEVLADEGQFLNVLLEMQHTNIRRILNLE